MSEADQTLGEVIRDRRRELKLDRSKLAELVGCDTAHIEYIERGRAFASTRLLHALADALTLDVARLTELREEALQAHERGSAHDDDSAVVQRKGFPNLDGRPCKLEDPAIRETILERLRVTGTIANGAAAAGVARETVHDWLRKGKDDAEGIYYDFAVAVELAKSNFVAMAAATHHKFAVGGVIKKARTKVIKDSKGNLLPTTECDLDPNTKAPVMVEHWVGPDPRCAEWELARLAPQEYASPDRDSQISRQSVDVRISLLDLLQRIGNIPDDTDEDRRRYAAECGQVAQGVADLVAEAESVSTPEEMK
jgi:transcriptional regulator with XRE-family HTH domain